MTRPQKATADYFPHYATGGAAGGKTLYTIENKYGNDGYAAWFKILELLTSSENHYFDCRSVDNWEFLQSKTHLEESKLSEVLCVLARLEAINPEFWKHRVIRSDNLIKNLSGLYSRRKANVISNDELAGLLFTETDSSDITKGLLHTETPASRVNVDKNPQSKVKESKVKESRGEKIGSRSEGFCLDNQVKVNNKEDTPPSDNYQEIKERENLPPGYYQKTLKALGLPATATLSPKDHSVLVELLKANCTFEDIEQARIKRKKNKLEWIQDTVCEMRDARLATVAKPDHNGIPILPNGYMDWEHMTFEQKQFATQLGYEK